MYLTKMVYFKAFLYLKFGDTKRSFFFYAKPMICLKHAIVQPFFWEVLMSLDTSKCQRTEPQNRSFNGLVQVPSFCKWFGFGLVWFGGLIVDQFLKHVFEHFKPTFDILRKIFKFWKIEKKIKFKIKMWKFENLIECLNFKRSENL